MKKLCDPDSFQIYNTSEEHVDILTVIMSWWPASFASLLASVSRAMKMLAWS